MKKIRVIAFILLAFLIVGTVYALYDEPRISGRGTSTLKVENPNPRPPSSKPNQGRLSGGICVYYKDAEDKTRETSVSFDLKGGASTSFSIPGTITRWGVDYCSAFEED